jgi:hypothetical protein
MKVFCNDCKWCRSPMSLGESERCKHPENQSNFVELKSYNMPTCVTKNEEGNCEKFQLKWWKFWRSETWRLARETKIET